MLSRRRQREKVELDVGASFANVGLGFDAWSIGLRRPTLHVTYESTDNGIITVVNIGPWGKEEIRNYQDNAGARALQAFRSAQNFSNGAKITYESREYPRGRHGPGGGGLGYSGAEAVGAIGAACLVYGIELTREQFITAAGMGEPGADEEKGTPGHLDNVAGSANGKSNIIAKSPLTGKINVYVIDVPEDLQMATGYSSHEKTTGTEAGRIILGEEGDLVLKRGEYVPAIGHISASVFGMAKGDVDAFLEYMWADSYHQPRRAEAGFYGNFKAREFREELQEYLFRNFHVAVVIMGAGPNLGFLYNRRDDENSQRQYNQSLVDRFTPYVTEWAERRGMKISVRPTSIAREGGVYDYVTRVLSSGPPRQR